jgi:C4-dicarboxylate transporter DctM subunit
MYALRGERSVVSVMTSIGYDTLSSWSLSVLPMFVLVGVVLSVSGLSARIFDAAKKCLSWMPGGLAVGTNVAGAGLAAVSGSSMATTYTLARMGMPEMLKAGYSVRYALTATMSAGLPGQLIPPSILLIIYAGVAEVPIGTQLLAGIVPGLVLVLLFSITFILLAKFNNAMTPKDAPKASFGEKVSSLIGLWPLVILMGIIVGGMYSGVLTATEAGAAAALASIIILFILKRNLTESWSALMTAGHQAVSTMGTIFMLLIGVEILARMMALTGISSGFSEFVTEADLSRVEFLLLMTLVYLVLGTFMETLPMLLLTVPVLLPTLAQLDISLIWFGVFFVLMGEIAMLSPPVGVLAMVVYTIVRLPEVNSGRKIDLKDVFVATAYVLPTSLLVVLLLIFFPGLATVIGDGA